MPKRYATVEVRDMQQHNDVLALLPQNYQCDLALYNDSGRIDMLISGEDVAGWTLEGYVIPRCASALYYVNEVHPEQESAV